MAGGPLGVRSVYGIPLRSRQSTLLGVLCVLDRRPRELSARERQAFSAVARQVAGQLAMWRRSGSASLAGSPGASAGAAASFAGERTERPGRLERQELVAAAIAADRPRLHVHREGADELLRSHEVAVLFDVTDRTVINWAAAHKLPSIRTAGGHLRFRGDDVLALLSGHPATDGRSA
jgi:excisionase family DNA binding protein